MAQCRLSSLALPTAVIPRWSETAQVSEFRFGAHRPGMTVGPNHFEADRQLLGPVHEGGLRHLHLAVERDRFQSRQQFLKQDAHFHLGEILPKAQVRAIAEGDVPVRLAVGAEPERFLEHLLVAVAGRVTQHEPIAPGDLPPAHFGIGSRRSHEGLDRGHPADRLIDEAGNKPGVGFDLCEFFRIFGQRPDRAGG